MAKTLDVAKAKKAGLSEEQIRKFLSENPDVTAPGFAAKSEPVGGLLGSILNPFIRTGKTIASGVFEGARGGATALAPLMGVKGKDQYRLYVNPETGETVKNPFQSEQELAGYDTGATGAKNIVNQITQQDTGTRQAAKDLVNVAGYAVPFGKGTNLLTKVLAPGAVVGLSQGLSEDTVTPAGLALQTAGGAAGAGLLAGAGRIGAKVGSTLVKGGERLAEKAGATFLKSSPAVFQKAAEAGININKTFNKYFKANDSVDAIIGAIEKPGGKVQALLSENEKIIDQVIKNSGDDVIATAEDLVTPLTKQLTKLTQVPGNAQKVESLTQFISEVQQLYPEGLTAKKLLEVKRLFDKQFGAAVVDDTTGAVIKDAQKSIANTARAKLKDTFSTIKNALDNESELLTLEPILQRARAGAETTLLKQSGGLGLLDFLTAGAALGLSGGNPLAAVGAVGAKKAVQSPAVLAGTGKVMKAVGGIPASTNNLLNNILYQGASRVGAGVGGMVDQQQPTDVQAPPVDQVQTVTPPVIDRSKLDPERQKALDIIDQAEAQARGVSAGDQQNVTGFSAEQLGRAYALAVQAGNTKAATQLKQMYELESAFQESKKDTAKPLAAVTENRVQLAQSGLRALDELEKIYQKDPSKVIKGALPGKLGARDYDSAAYRAVEGLLRARSGAAVPESEVKRYMNANLPRVGDMPADVQFKLAAFRKDLEAVAQSGGGSDVDQLRETLSAQGISL